MRVKWLCFLLVCFFAFSVAAEDEDEAEAEEGESEAKPSAIYLPLKPSFVVNYGGAGRLKYLKVDVSARLSDGKTASAVRHHLPLIRNNLVMLFASQSDETLDSFAGKEALRKEVLAEIRKIVLQEEGIEEGVVDAYFDSLIVQK